MLCRRADLHERIGSSSNYLPYDHEGVITLGDLDEFSEELREVVATITEPHKDI